MSKAFINKRKVTKQTKMMVFKVVYRLVYVITERKKQDHEILEKLKKQIRQTEKRMI